MASQDLKYRPCAMHSLTVAIAVDSGVDFIIRINEEKGRRKRSGKQ